MTVKELIEKLQTFPSDADVELILNFDADDLWEVGYNEEDNIVRLTNEG